MLLDPPPTADGERNGDDDCQSGEGEESEADHTPHGKELLHRVGVDVDTVGIVVLGANSLEGQMSAEPQNRVDDGRRKERSIGELVLGQVPTTGQPECPDEESPGGKGQPSGVGDFLPVQVDEGSDEEDGAESQEVHEEPVVIGIELGGQARDERSQADDEEDPTRNAEHVHSDPFQTRHRRMS